jgi:hypothetical protein
MGCGRSGTTILGIVLGNGENCLDLGEVIDFLKKKGIPNGFGPDSETGKFWKSVTNDVVNTKTDIFDLQTIADLTTLEHHKHFPLTFLDLCKPAFIKNYSAYVNALYTSISDSSEKSTVYIESSKYPGRALLLFSLLREFDLRILHVVRHPIKVVESLGDRTKADSQGYKGFFAANLYYFVVNLFCSAVRLKVGGEKYLKIRYEDLLTAPDKTLVRVEKHFDVDFHRAIERIQNDRPLRRGYIFNGNRMRMNSELVLKKSGKQPFKRSIKNFTSMAFNGLWY